jgi:YD repeat-containing protein
MMVPDVKFTKIIDSGINEWEFKNDIMGNAIEMIYPDGSKIKQGYDIIGRLTSFTIKRNQEITYQYDLDDRLKKKITPEGDTDFTYDFKDRLTDVSAPCILLKEDAYDCLQESNFSSICWCRNYCHSGCFVLYQSGFQ